MTIYRRLSAMVLSFEDKASIGTAYELLLTKMRLSDRNDPVTEVVATRIIEAFEAGERDPASICAHAMEKLGADNLEERG